jgi:hypothetical protein
MLDPLWRTKASTETSSAFSVDTRRGLPLCRNYLRRFSGELRTDAQFFSASRTRIERLLRGNRPKRPYSETTRSTSCRSRVVLHQLRSLMHQRPSRHREQTRGQARACRNGEALEKRLRRPQRETAESKWQRSPVDSRIWSRRLRSADVRRPCALRQRICFRCAQRRADNLTT